MYHPADSATLQKLLIAATLRKQGLLAGLLRVNVSFAPLCTVSLSVCPHGCLFISSVCYNGRCTARMCAPSEYDLWGAAATVQQNVRKLPQMNWSWRSRSGEAVHCAEAVQNATEARTGGGRSVREEAGVAAAGFWSAAHRYGSSPCHQERASAAAAHMTPMQRTRACDGCIRLLSHSVIECSLVLLGKAARCYRLAQPRTRQPGLQLVILRQQPAF